MSFRDLYDLSYHILGTGTTGTVHYGTEIRTNQAVAIKVLDKKQVKFDPETFKYETELVLSLCHPNIARVHGFYESWDRVYIVQELCTGGDIFTYVIERKYYSEDDARSLVRQVCQALCYLHSRNIAHLGIKPENLLMQPTQGESREFNSTVKLIDTMLSQYLHGGPPELQTHYIAFASPEVLQKRPYSTEPDVYAMGVTTYLLLGGILPFDETEDKADIINKKDNKDWTFTSPNFDGISTEAKDFISRCLDPDPITRITAFDALKHPWICNPPPHIVPLSGTQSQLERYLASLKFRALVRANDS